MWVGEPGNYWMPDNNEDDGGGDIPNWVAVLIIIGFAIGLACIVIFI